MRAYQFFPVEDACALYAAGHSLRQVGLALGVTGQTVRRWLKWAGVARRPRGGANHRKAAGMSHMEGTA